MSVTNVFSHSVSSSFILVTASFAEHKLSSFMESCLFSRVLRLPEEIDPKKLLLRLMSKSTLLVFSCRSFVVSELRFTSLFYVYARLWHL